METDAVASVNGQGANGTIADSSVTGTDSSVAAEPVAAAVTETAEVKETAAPVAESTTDTKEGAKDEVSTGIVDSTVPEEEKPSQKRPNEESEHDNAVAKKVARLENGDGVTHAVVGEPEVEPHTEESKKVNDVEMAGATEEVAAATAVEQEAAV